MNTASDTLTLGSLFDGSGGFPLPNALYVLEGIATLNNFVAV